MYYLHYFLNSLYDINISVLLFKQVNRLDSDSMIDLEFTLGRPNWEKEHEESSRELSLLKC